MLDLHFANECSSVFHNAFVAVWSCSRTSVQTALSLPSTLPLRRCQGKAAGTALRLARRTKKHTYPELLQGNSRCRLVFVLEVGDRCSAD